MLKSIVCGIPQGSIIGPYLSLIYVNDIFNLCTNSKCVLFADDTTVLTSGNNFDTLFSDSCSVFAAYSIWFADNILALNSKKTNFVLFSLSNHKVPNSIKFDLHTVNSVSSVKYRGYFLDSHLKWRQHVINVNDKIAQGLCMLRLCKSFLPCNCLLNIYYAFVYPHLIYGVKYWGCAAKTVLHDIKIFQNKCIRVLCNADFYAHVPPVAKSTNIMLFDDLHKYCVLNLMCKIHLKLC